MLTKTKCSNYKSEFKVLPFWLIEIAVINLLLIIIDTDQLKIILTFSGSKEQ